MANYYATVAGLPNLGVEDRKLPFSSSTFAEELQDVLTNADRRLLDLIRYEDDNALLIAYLENPEESKKSSKQPTLINFDEVDAVLEAMRDRAKLPQNNLPSYVIDFLRETQIEKNEDELESEATGLDDEEQRTLFPIHLVDRLAEYYYMSALLSSNAFIRDWAHFNLNIKNVFAASVARQLEWDPADYVVGDGEVERKLKSSVAANFGLTEDDLSYLPQLQAILNESDITRRERMIDVLRWNWLEDRVFDHPFDIEAILCYYLQLRIVERWTDLNEKTGEETFRKIVANLKKESNASLEEFKRNQKK